jgi:hypothetical protein
MRIKMRIKRGGKLRIGSCADFDERAAVNAVGDDGGSVGTSTCAAEDDSSGVEMELTGNVEATGGKKQSATETIRGDGTRGNTVERRLQKRSVVAARGPDEEHGFDGGQRVASAFVASIGEIDVDGAWRHGAFRDLCGQGKRQSQHEGECVQNSREMSGKQSAIEHGGNRTEIIVAAMSLYGWRTEEDKPRSNARYA